MLLAVALPVAMPLHSAAAQQQSEGIIAKGTPAETSYYVQDSDVAGPTVMIVGGIHGNEPAGAFAAEQIRHWPIRRGKLIVLPRANVPALRANKRYTPSVDAPVRNLNRNFPYRDRGVRGITAKAVWDLVNKQRPHWLIDLHEGFDYRLLNSKSVGNSIIVFPSAEARRVTPLMLGAVNDTVAQAEKRFIKIGPPVRRSLSYATAEQLGAHAMILETSRKDQPISTRTRQHRIMVRQLLGYLEMLDDEVTHQWLLNETDAAERPTRVALYDAGGSLGAAVERLYEYFAAMKNTTVMHVGPEDIRSGALAQFDVVTFPDCLTEKLQKVLGEKGIENINDFIRQGGGFLGVCGGSILAARQLAMSMEKVEFADEAEGGPSETSQGQLELSPEAQEVLGIPGGMLAAASPSYKLMPAAGENEQDSAHYKVLAWFDDRSPAIVASEYGSGRMLCIGLQPTETPELQEALRRGTQWCARRDP